jgi:glycosyltransferase involved in cell wall biosynthesis
VGELDAVLFHTQVTSLFSVGLMGEVPSVISLDATPINYDSVGRQYGHRPPSDNLVDRKKYQLNRQAFHAAAGLVTWSEWARRSLVDDYGVDGARVRVLAPGAGSAFFDIGRARETTDDGDDDSQRVRLLFVGADFHRKGGPMLLESLKGPLGERCELHVVTRSEVPAQPNVIMHRGLEANGEALLQLFANAHVFVLPTEADCMAVALMEAAAAGLPVITSDVGAMNEGLTAGESGLLIPAGDRGALQAALEAIIGDPGRRHRMGRASSNLARERFDAQRNNRLVLDFVREVVAARPAARRAA